MILVSQPSDAAVASCQVSVRLCLVSGLVFGLETQGIQELGLFLVSSLREFVISSKVGNVNISYETLTGRAWMHMVARLKLVLRARSRAGEKLHSLFGLEGR